MSEIRVHGKVTIHNGDRVIVAGKKNRILRNSIRAFASATLCQYVLARSYRSYSSFYYTGISGIQIYFGKSNNANTYTTDGLVSQLNANANTIANSAGLIINDSYARTTFAATWNAGVLNALLSEGEKLEEIALNFYLFESLSPGWTVDTGYSSSAHVYKYFNRYTFSRVVLGADAFIPDPNYPVVVAWEIGVDLV